MPEDKPKLKLLDLFSGILVGGFSLGLERSGAFETVAFCEIEPFCRRVLAKHWPGVPCYDDVRTLTAERLAADGIAVDAICGGFPCQDISVAGKGLGLAGERSGLWREITRLAGELRPRIIILENVAALLGRGLGDVLGDLAALGYDAEWHCIPAAAVGAPHRRDRIWIVAYPGDSRPPRTRRGDEHESALRVACDCGAEDAPPLADAHSLHGQGQQPSGVDAQGWPRTLIGSIGSCRDGGGWWSIEPDVGGSPDGFPAFLDRYVGRGLSYEASRRAIKTLRSVWSDHVSQTLRRAIGRLDRLQQAELLFAFVREYEAGTDEARILVAGEEAPESFLRSLRRHGEAASAPHRPRPDEQRAGEYPDAVQILPRLLALDGAPHWAGSGWEDATPRVANGIPDRAHRLKALGNAVVPQIPELIGRAIAAAFTDSAGCSSPCRAAPEASPHASGATFSTQEHNQ